MAHMHASPIHAMCPFCDECCAILAMHIDYSSYTASTMDRFTLPLLPMLLLVASSCDGSPQQEQIGNGQYGYTGQQQAVPTQQGATGTMQNTATGGEKVVMHPVTDPNTGMVSQQVPCRLLGR